MAIVLIGFMGAGKSTAAREIGAALGQQVFDSDELLAKEFGHSVAEEFARSGEAIVPAGRGAGGAASCSRAPVRET